MQKGSLRTTQNRDGMGAVCIVVVCVHFSVGCSATRLRPSLPLLRYGRAATRCFQPLAVTRMESKLTEVQGVQAVQYMYDSHVLCITLCD
jgi:hypothetical protein